MKDINYYTTTKTEYKSRSEFKKELVKELETFVGTVAELDAKRKEIDENATHLYNENYRKLNEEKSKLIEEFKNDIAIENGVENHPKLNLLWMKAWEHGHSCGLHEVKYWFEDLVELLS